jgi:hypothetical protein
MYVRNFREFEAGPDPFGRTWRVEFKWLLTAIYLRHSDSVDVKFILRCDDIKVEKTIALRHPDLLESRGAARKAECRAHSEATLMTGSVSQRVLCATSKERRHAPRTHSTGCPASASRGTS